MAHQRQAIRKAVQAALVAASTSAGSRVLTTRMVPWHRSELPAVGIYTLEETVDDKASGPRELTRSLQLAIEAGVNHADDAADDILDALCLQIEQAMHVDFTFGGACSDSVLASTEIDVAEVGNRTVMVARMVYSVRYYTYAPDAADQTLPTLNTADVKYDLGDAQPVGDQAEDKLLNLET